MVSCRQVRRELSNYIDDTVDPELRKAIEKHLRWCHRCSVVLDTTRKTLTIYSDEGVLEIPAGYSERLRASFLKKIEKHQS
jgi:Putative zinc-finger